MALSKKKTKQVILNDLHDLKDVDKLKNQARASAKELNNYAQRFGTLARDFLNIANDEAVEARQVVTKRIKDEPLKSAAIAFIAGYVAHAIFHRGE